MKKNHHFIEKETRYDLLMQEFIAYTKTNSLDRNSIYVIKTFLLYLSNYHKITRHSEVKEIHIIFFIKYLISLNSRDRLYPSLIPLIRDMRRIEKYINNMNENTSRVNFSINSQLWLQL